MKLNIPEFALVVLIGATGSGKSTFARRHFRPSEIISSDWARGAVADDENDQSATPAAFELVHFLAAKRLAGRRLTVIDATNVRPEDRKPIVEIARAHHALPVAVVLDLDASICAERNRTRPDRDFGRHVVRSHVQALRRGMRTLDREGFRIVHRLRSLEEIDGVEIERQRLWTDRRDITDALDIVGDVHGCADELEALLARLGHLVRLEGAGEDRRASITQSSDRKVAFVGDLVDRGPRIADVLRIVMAMVEAGRAICVLGNHEAKLLRWFEGRKVQPTHGLQQSIDQLSAEPASFRDAVRTFLDGLVSHYWLDRGRLVVAHAGIKESMVGRASGAIRAFCLYGDTSGETDEFGLPVRHNWAAEYRGDIKIVYGHTPRQRRNGSTTRSASTRAAFSAASSRRCAIRSSSWSRFPRIVSTVSPRGPYALRRPPGARRSRKTTTFSTSKTSPASAF